MLCYLSNAEVAAVLEEIGKLRRLEGANPFRVAAYRNAAVMVRASGESLAGIFERDGLAGLKRLPGIGDSLAKKIATLFRKGRSPTLRKQATGDLLTTLPTIGPRIAERIHGTLHAWSLEDVLAAARDGRLQRVEGVGRKRAEAIRDTLAARLNERRSRRGLPAGFDQPTVADLLGIDRQYRNAALEGRLLVVAPKRYNPAGVAWLPILHTERGPRRYVAHFANTARSHRLGKTHDWVVIRCEDKNAFGMWTVLTAGTGELAGQRVVRGRETECLEYYRRGKLVQLSLPEA